MTGTVDSALAFALAEHNDASQDWSGWCQRFTRMSWDVAALYPTAAIAWAHAQHKHTSWPPPPGAPCFWTGGPHGFGHAALSSGEGNIWSTDILRRGEVDHVALALITQKWGLNYVGWTEDINDVELPVGYEPSDPGGEVIDPPTDEEEEDSMRFIHIVGEPADDNVYGYTDDQWWIATDEEASAFGGSRQVNARQRDVIRSRVFTNQKERLGAITKELPAKVLFQIPDSATPDRQYTFQGGYRVWIGAGLKTALGLDGVTIMQLPSDHPFARVPEPPA